MERIRTLVFHPAAAPYRTDLFNRLSAELDLRVVFMERRIEYDPNADQRELLAQLRCDYRVLKHNLRIAGHDVRLGILPEIRSFKPQVVVTHEFSHATFSILLHRGLWGEKRFGLTVWTDENVAMLRKRDSISAALLKTGVRKAQSLIVCSRKTAKALAAFAHAEEEKMFVCAPNHDEIIFRKKLDEAISIARRYIRDHELVGKVVLLSVGRLAPVKNTASLLAAFSRIARSCPNSMLVLAGDGPQKAELVAQAAKLCVSEQVLFTGHLKGSDLWAWWRLASVFVLASTFEPYGAVVCEALISGVQVLCSSAAGAGVLIEPGKNGRVFDPLDIDNLASLLKEEVDKGALADELVETKRQSLMPIPFEQQVSSFVAAVEYAADSCKARGFR